MSPRLRAGLALAATFVAGVAAGVLLLPLIHRPPPPRPDPVSVPPLSELGLDAHQQDQARRILESHRPALEDAIRPALPRVRAVQDEVERELREILTPAQRAELDALRASGRTPPPPLPIPPPRQLP